jgi:hypothetical protein
LGQYARFVSIGVSRLDERRGQHHRHAIDSASSGFGARTAGDNLDAACAEQIREHIGGDGDTYTVTCPGPAGIEPLAVKLELLTDPSLSKQGPGRRADGMLAIAEVSFAGVRGDAPATAIEVLDVRSDRPEAPNTNLVDGRTESVWSQPSDGKNHEAVFTIGLPSRTGGDGAQWRYPASSSKPLTSLVVTIAHPDGPDFGAATLGKFRLVVLHENPAAVKKEAAK